MGITVPKILIIDDSEALRIQLREALESSSFEVVECTNGIEGLEIINNNSGVDLILCDQNMPRMDGITFCQNMNENFKELKIPIVMLTTETNPELKKRSKEFGVKGWIMKPFVKENLILGIEYLLKKNKSVT